MGVKDQVVQEVGVLRVEIKWQKTYDTETRELQEARANALYK